MNIVVIGAGLTGANAVEELRNQGYAGDITLIGAEPHLPYERPPLSKGLLLGTAEPGSVFAHDHDWYADHQVDLRLGSPVTELDLGRRRVGVTGTQIAYDRLLLATGASPRRLPLAEPSNPDVVYLRTLDDALRLRARLTGHILIIGAGWIGLEVAAAARQADATVTVVEAGSLPLLGVLGPELAPLFVGLHREHGVDLRLSTTVDSLTGTQVDLSDGTRIHADTVLVGIGAKPEDQLAAQAGLATDNGVLVDARLRTSDPHVCAAGDVANHDHPRLRRLRVEHWDNAIQQGKHAARTMLGDDTPYVRQPYFFTDQYDLGMEYVGHVGHAGYDEVVIRGDADTRVLTAFWIRDNEVRAGMHLNDWDAIDPIRSLVEQGTTDLDALRDPEAALPVPSG
ncbi:NAD(P)/FAD-dependent oxidoreductase [Promicromonospora soli]|uniref:Pyridine nucleotide-disulfide oxidoreductase n=1 Tax=Promicromonospora soli TaxID=2035533 RepID=A0A919KP73_9MICO|nr:FAD-dependent oxidoreductase [Promicromonospora soli]GHH66461.1 pyridine nucleotide-disulfide oxidoreductase [Promicromonospora soli]